MIGDIMQYAHKLSPLKFNIKTPKLYGSGEKGIVDLCFDPSKKFFCYLFTIRNGFLKKCGSEGKKKVGPVFQLPLKDIRVCSHKSRYDKMEEWN